MFSRAPSLCFYFKGVVAVAGLAVITAVASQPAAAVSLTFNSTTIAPGLCPSGSCTYDVLTTSDVPPFAAPFPASPISFQTLYSLPLNGYSYQFIDSTTASLFATAYDSSSAPTVLKTANNGVLGALPSTPSTSGGPLFFTSLNTLNFPSLGNSLTQANGQYYSTGAAVNFTTNVSGIGNFSGIQPQSLVWSIFKCTSGSCLPTPPPPSSAVPAPLPFFGLAAAFAYSRRLRQRIARLQS
jgi:hypothetical protein